MKSGTICTSALVPMRGAPWAEELASALGGKKLGKQWSACCPAHDDKSPSLIIFEGRTGAVQVRCMAGCEPIEIIAEIRWHEVADRLSMTPAARRAVVDSRPQHQSGRARAPSRPEFRGRGDRRRRRHLPQDLRGAGDAAAARAGGAAAQGSGGATMIRRSLPQRRAAETFDLRFWNQPSPSPSVSMPTARRAKSSSTAARPGRTSRAQPATPPWC